MTRHNIRTVTRLMAQLGQLGVPVLDIGGRIVIGFDQPQIDAALDEAK